MQRRRYVLKALVKTVAVLTIPPIVWRVIIGHFFPLKDFWKSFFWTLLIWDVFIAFLANIAQFSGWSLRDWLGWDVLRIYHAFELTTRRTLHGVRDTLPVLDCHLERSEVQEVWKLLEQGRPTLIEGESGTGKSGIAAAVVRQAMERGVPALFLDTRNYSSAVSAFGGLKQYVGVKLPLRDCLEKLASHMGSCLLVVDQLDSTIGTPACQVSTELLAVAKTLERVNVIAVSCMLEAAEYQSIRDLAFEVVKSDPLERNRVFTLLHEVGIVNPSEAVLILSENLFYLSLVAELAAQVDASQVAREVALLEKYQTTLERIEGPKVIQTAVDLAYEKLHDGRMDFALSRMQGRALQRLQNRGIVKATGHGLYRFRHEKLFYYFYALGTIEKDIQPANILARIGGRRSEDVLAWVLRLMKYSQSPELLGYLKEALAESEQLDFYEKAALLDEIQTWDDIATYPAALEIISEVLSTDTSLERYFFKHLAESENPGWFEPLRQRGFFDTPPEPIKHEEGISFPRWPALWYLIAVAPKLPEGVIEIAERVHTQNPFVMLGFVQAAQIMPPTYTARMVPLVIRWTDEGMKVEKEVISLAVFLAQGGEWEAALTLVELILSPQEQQVSKEARQSPYFFPEAVSKADRYYVQTFVEQELAFFLEHCPFEVLCIVQANLERVFEIEERDSSSIWRPAIEPHEQNHGFGDIKELLVGAARKTLERLAESEPDRTKTILEEYLKHRYSIFRRLAIHTIRLNAALWPDLVEHLFTDQQFLEDTEIFHEYWMLMHDTFDSLPAPAQDSFAERLLNRLPQEPMEDDRQYLRQQYWVIRRLWAIKDSLTSKECLGILDEWEREHGEPEHPSFLSYSRTMVGWTSSRTPQDLSEMPLEEVVSELRKNLPFHAFDAPSQEGLARALEAAVVSNPQNFAPIALELFGPDIPPIHTSHALRGFRDAWKEGKGFDWEPVLRLCEKVSETSEEAPESGEPPDMLPGYWEETYAGARSAVADLLAVGVVRDDDAIPREFLGQVRDILLVLADDPNPSPEYERRWGIENPIGIEGLVLNVTRGKAVETLLRYALHVARISAKECEADEETPPTGSWLEDVVKDKLTEKLDKQTDPSLAIHFLFGEYLPNLHYLNAEWVIAHLEDIFPRQPEMSDYWEAAWDGYLLRGDFFGYLYEMLKPYYRHAIKQMALGTQGKAGSDLSCGRLARHLAALYCRGIETLEDEDSLIPQFFASVPDEIRAGFIVGLGAGLREVSARADSEEWLRAKVLWQARSQAIGEMAQKEDDLSGFTKELSAFSSWTPHIPEDLENLYAVIEMSALVAESWDVVRLLEFLSSVTKDHNLFVVSLLEKLLRQDRGPWFLATQHERIRAVLETAMSSGDEQAKTCAVRIINLLGERGDERYRDLLKPG